jgi:hypothetical protein
MIVAVVVLTRWASEKDLRPLLGMLKKNWSFGWEAEF